LKEIIKEKGKLQNAHLSTGLFGQYHRQACDMHVNKNEED